MGLPRSSYVNDDEVGVYHCFTRCVRRAFLSGFDPVSGRDYSHRKSWIVGRLRFLAGIFAIEVCAYAVMENHNHTVLRNRPDIVQTWSDREVAIRWLTLFPNYNCKKDTVEQPTEQQISALAENTERIAVLRKRLSSISWFMGRLNEFIARAANKEDNVKGRFWESRFKCQALLDEAAIAACMVYVDLNPIRAGLAPTPEQSDFTSIQERIRAWQNEMTSKALISSDLTQHNPDPSSSENMPVSEDKISISGSIPEPIPADSFETPSLWLCPIQSDSQRRGILQMT